jgi:hypothetical protein
MNGWQHLKISPRHSGMKIRCHVALLCSFSGPLLSGADPALTIYNQNFVVVRETLSLDLKAGNNVVLFSGATAQLEPDSVILRNPGSGQVSSNAR